MAAKPLHPSQRFVAPSSIQAGVSLKEIIDRRLVALIGESLAAVVPGFDEKAFLTAATRGLDQHELKGRAAHVAGAMADQLPSDFDAAAPRLIRSFGPELKSSEGNGLAVFFYLPHAEFIASWGVGSFESGMQANYELTKRFSAEFSVRPFLAEHRDDALRMFADWAKDPNPHVRRLVSEGSRPRLPWASRLPEFQKNPNYTLPLLELLKDDPELYVRRSVANHLGDIAKDHADVVFDLCEAWLGEIRTMTEPERQENRRWILRHAVRHPAKQGVPRALDIRQKAAIGGRGVRRSKP